MVCEIPLMDDPFFQEVTVQIGLNNSISAGHLNREMKSACATLFYDVYGFQRTDTVPEWQSECFADVYLYLNGKSVDALGAVDRIDLAYPMATIGTEHINSFCTLVNQVAKRFGASVEVNGEVVTEPELLAHLDAIATQILMDWGEEPGSRSLAILIEASL